MISQKIKIVLIAAILIVIGGIVAVFISYRNILDRPDILVSSFNKEADLSLNKIHQTATRGGVREWSLDAVSAHYSDQKKQALLKDLTVIFYLKDGSRVDLTADQGLLRTDTKDIQASGNVRVKNRIYHLQTETIQYQHEGRLIFSTTPVKIWSDAFDLSADRLSFDLNTNQTQLKGNVKGTFSEKIKL